jgi:hypothetical protein
MHGGPPRDDRRPPRQPDHGEAAEPEVATYRLEVVRMRIQRQRGRVRDQLGQAGAPLIVHDQHVPACRELFEIEPFAHAGTGPAVHVHDSVRRTRPTHEAVAQADPTSAAQVSLRHGQTAEPG